MAPDTLLELQQRIVAAARRAALMTPSPQRSRTIAAMARLAKAMGADGTELAGLIGSRMAAEVMARMDAVP